MIFKAAAFILITACLVNPAFSSPQCRVKANGAIFFDWLSCSITATDTVITFNRGKYFKAEIKGGFLKSNIYRLGGPKDKIGQMDVFGKVTENLTDGGMCYTTPKLEVCSGDSED